MHYNLGKKNGRYIDGRSSTTYYCNTENCNNIVAGRTDRKGNPRVCRTCAGKKKAKKLMGKGNPNWRRGKRKTELYSVVYSVEHKDNWVYEHRLVMEKHLGRKLRPEEVVHHENGDKKDNRLSNLRLFNNNGEHIAYHAKNKEMIT